MNEAPVIKYLSREEACAFLRCSMRKMEGKVKKGLITPVRDGRRILFKLEDVEALINKQ